MMRALVAIALMLVRPVSPYTEQVQMPAGAQAKAEVEQVMEQLVQQAASLLEKHGEFYPLGGYLSSTGRFALTAVYDGNEHPESAKVILGLRQAFGQSATKGKYRAIGLAYDVRVTAPGVSTPTDAVLVELEHATGYRVNVYWPYTGSPKDPPRFGAAFAVEGTLRGFSPSAPPPR